jgi:hypothetical protein
VSEAKNHADEVSAYASAKVNRYEIEDATIAVRVVATRKGKRVSPSIWVETV